MNTQFSSEMFFLQDALNDPVSYEDMAQKRAKAESAGARTNPISWLPKLLDWLSLNIFRAGRAVPSA
jgi:hypothetical protein